MDQCQCDGPGWCPVRRCEVSPFGLKVCRSGTPRSVAAYFGDGGLSPPTPRSALVRREAGGCAYLGGPVVAPDGRAETRDCRTCKGNVRLKVFACLHPGHSADPTTTVRGCQSCPDYRATLPDEPPVEEDLPPMPSGTIPVPMVAPGQRRKGVEGMLGGVIQIMTTRSCDLACTNCTAGSHLRSRSGLMTPDQFQEACRSLEGYWGVVGVFGGNATTSRYFEDYCRILKAHFPLKQRGLWCNNLNGKGRIAAQTFDPKHSNINVHQDSAAYEEFRRDWPAALDARKSHTTAGLTDDSLHSSPWVSMTDLGVPQAERWKLIGDCDINKYWSAIVCLVGGKLRAFFCEIAGHMAALHADNPDWAGSGGPMADIGLAVEPGWWRRPMADFEAQVRTCCHHCGVPMRRPGQPASGGVNEFSETHRFIARPRAKAAPAEFVEIGGIMERPDRPSTEYLAGTTPRVQA